MHEDIVQFLETECNAGTFPGFQLAFLEAGKFSTTEFGNSQVVPFKTPLEGDPYYDLASLTKALIGVMSLKLAETGLLDLEAPVKTYLPAFTSEVVTVRHLLTHTAGLTGYIENRNNLSEAALIKALLNLTPQWLPGQQMIYSDHHYLILGFVLEAATGKSLAVLLNELINIPLGTDFTYYPLAPKCVPTMPLYDKKQQWVVNLQGVVHDPKARILQGEAGHAGMFGRLSDLEKFLQALLADFLSPASQFLAFNEQTQGFMRGFGFKLDKAPSDGHFIFSHTGYTGTLLIGDNQTKRGLIFLCNRVHPDDLRQSYIEKRDEMIEMYLSKF